MKLFAVFKEGVLRHECGGIFDSLDLATAAAEMLLAGERDGYHDYFIVPFSLNQVTTQTPVGDDWWQGGELKEADPVLKLHGQKRGGTGSRPGSTAKA